MEKLNVSFYPWVGKDYFTTGFNSKKVLILGESHYGYQEYDKDDSEKKEATIDAVEKYLHRQKFSNEENYWISTYTKLTKICLDKNEITEDDKDKFWDSIIFYNYLTVSLAKPGDRPTDEQWRDSEDDFFKVLQYYQPDIILVLGEQLWNKTPQKSWKLSDTNTNLGYYLIDEKKIYASSIYHPASHYQYGNKEYDSKVIFKNLINTKI